MTTADEKRAATKERVKKWRDKRQASGMKHLSVMLKPETHELLKKEKERSGKTYSEIIEDALNIVHPEDADG